MAEIKMLIPKVEAISIFDLVRKLREQRWAMVYTPSQY
jgi:protein tyrosine phosphatase